MIDNLLAKRVEFKRFSMGADDFMAQNESMWFPIFVVAY